MLTLDTAAMFQPPLPSWKVPLPASRNSWSTTPFKSSIVNAPAMFGREC